jgi:hypothetical protein
VWLMRKATAPESGDGYRRAMDPHVSHEARTGVIAAALAAVPGVRAASVDASEVRIDLGLDADESEVVRGVTAVLRHVFAVEIAAPDGAGVQRGFAEIPTPRAQWEQGSADPRAVPVPVPYLTVIRGGRDAGPDHPLAGAVPQVPDLDMDMLRESEARHPAGQVRSAREHAERIRLRERSSYVPPLLDAEVPRPVLVRLRTVSSSSQTSISVTLRFAGMLIEGSADTVPTPQSTREAVVTATIDALGRVIDPSVGLTCAAVAIVELGGSAMVDEQVLASGGSSFDSGDVDAHDGRHGSTHGSTHGSANEPADDIAIVRVRMQGIDGLEDLIGVSTVRDDSRAAIARATLDAVNRRISAMYTL